ncbi:MAG: TlpA disulfide reductase family protein [Desulfobacteraceae bacterium]|nr:TlpA disulfide reductase family protein [Desulfobacteraceae bacterium]
MTMIRPWFGLFSLISISCLCLLAACGGGQDRPLAIGETAPAFTAQDLRGQMVSLAASQGKPVILRFFLPDCKFCRADTPIFNQYYRDYRDKGLTILYINTEPKPGEVQKFADDLRIAFPVVLDPTRKIANRYRVRAVPQTVVLDPSHKVIGVILGGVSKEQLDELLGPFLKQPRA